MHINLNKRSIFNMSGFTLIELLVVIAIISLLASVVLASLNSARAKGGDAAIKSNLNSIRSQAELFATVNNFSYGGTAHAENTCLTTSTGNIVGDPTILAAILTANQAAGGSISSNRTTQARCAVSSTSYAIAVTLRTVTNNSWCLASSGITKQVAVAASSASAILGTGTSASPYICGN